MSDDAKAETTFEYPISDSLFVKSVSVRSGRKGKWSQSKVVDREDVDQNYSDDVAKGKLVVMGKSETESQKMVLTIGNILPRKSVFIKLVTIQPTLCINGAFNYSLPV